ncbi:hypothetical protein N0V90_013518 [Kalmusia sp. IMI 367209]|nr:hypothetical protein N0V90_013518 [Kalmusia sp. IMI 367209]
MARYHVKYWIEAEELWGFSSSMFFVIMQDQKREWITGSTVPKIEGWDWLEDICKEIRDLQLGSVWQGHCKHEQTQLLELEGGLITKEKALDDQRDKKEETYDARVKTRTQFHSKIMSYGDSLHHDLAQIVRHGRALWRGQERKANAPPHDSKKPSPK